MILGLTGKAYSGKTTLAGLISVQFGVQATVIPMAKPLKDLAREFGWDGKKDTKGRRFLQILGTEIGRCYIPTYWLDKWEVAAMTRAQSWSGGFVTKESVVIADDMRYDNEAERVHLLGGKTIHVAASLSTRERRAKAKGESLPPEHASERGIDDKLVDMRIENEGSIGDLRDRALQIIVELLRTNDKPDHH